MTKVITYGTYDLLHYGHIRLLERAKALGDYLIVGVTADDFDKTRGKINVQQSLMERIEGVRRTGLADEIIVEEYEGQKIDDIKKYDIDIFTVGSDWVGKFDYLNDYCKVVYLERTKGVSSSEIREAKRKIKVGLIGDSLFLNKVIAESRYVNGAEAVGVCTDNAYRLSDAIRELPVVTGDFEELLGNIDAVYVRSEPEGHFSIIKRALEMGKHVLCESPITLNKRELKELFKIADKNGLILMEAIKTAYSTAYERLLLLIKTGIIGEVVSVDVTCTSLADGNYLELIRQGKEWAAVYEWGPTALLPVFQILGTNYINKNTFIRGGDENRTSAGFIKADFEFDNAVATIKAGNSVKSEGELIISGTKGYVYVPAPWWKTDYFEIRFENPNENRRFFYQLDGEGIRYELVAFIRNIETGSNVPHIDRSVSEAITSYMQSFITEE